ncbi:hypothetical protein CKW48_21635, partial [Bordetella pertussis]
SSIESAATGSPASSRNPTAAPRTPSWRRTCRVMAMLHKVRRSSIESAATGSPASSRNPTAAPRTPSWRRTCRV